MVVVLLPLFVFVLIVVGVGCFVVVLVWDASTKENTTKKTCFIVFCCAVVLTDLWPQKGQQPKAKKSMFLPFSPKMLPSAERSGGFRAVIVFLLCLCFFFCLNSGSHFEGQVQGPQMCLIFGDFWWSSNRRFVDPERSLKGLCSAERSLF